MDAIISGRAGVALLLDGDSLASFDVDEPNTLLPRCRADVRLLFGEAPDLQFIEDTDHGRAARELKRAFDSASALDLALIILDAELSDEVRGEAVEELEYLLSDSQITKSLENVLYGRPLPEEGDIAGALKRCDAKRTPKLFAALQILEGYQPVIREVCKAWDELPSQLFGGMEEKSVFQSVAVREGLFRELTIECAAQRGVGTLLIRWGLNSAITALKNYRLVLQPWTQPFRPRAANLDVRHEADEYSKQAGPTQKRQRGRRKNIDRAAALKNVQSQKALIAKALRERDFERARKIVDELVAYQLEHGEPIHAVKSLCDLATEAKELGINSLQLELTERAINILPDDGWTWAQYADALLKLQRPTEALKAYEQAESFGAGDIAKRGRAEMLKALGRLHEAFAAYDAVLDENIGDVVAKNGRAETLRALGRLNDALAAYNATIAEHPEDVVAKTGRAETLRALGRLNDALAAYDMTVDEHPESVVAKSGRAETLRALGRPHEALAAYDAIIAEHPEDVVAKNGRAEVLKALGRLHDALAAYDAVLAGNVENSIARTGRIGVLVALRRYDEALESLPDENPVTLDDWIGYHIRGMIMLRKGKIDEAVRIFEHGVKEDPIPSSKEYFRNALAVAYLRQRDFARAESALEGVNMPLLQPQANVLRLHTFGASGKDAPAVAAYEKLSDKPWFISDDLMSELHRRYILKEEPLHDDDWVFEQEMDIFLFDSNQQTLSSTSLPS